MEYSVLGRTGMKVSRICLGTATFGVAPTADDADQVVGAARDLGINFVDTADVYGNMPVFDRPGAPRVGAGTGRADPRPCPARPPRRDGDRDEVQRHLGPRRQRPRALPPAHHPSGRDEPAPPADGLHRPLLRPRPRPGHPARGDPGGLRRPHPARARSATSACRTTPPGSSPRPVDRRRPASAGPGGRGGEVQPHRPGRRARTRPACEQFGVSIVPYAPLHGGLLADLAVLDRACPGISVSVSRVPRRRIAWRGRSTASAAPGPCPVPGVAGLAAVPPCRRLRHRRPRNHRRAPRQRHRGRRPPRTRPARRPDRLAIEPAAFQHRAGDGTARARRHRLADD